MNDLPHASRSPSAPMPPPPGLRWWLSGLTLVAILTALVAVGFGLLINMDTQIEMNPNGDALVRQAALGFRLFAWGGVALLVVLLAVGIIWGWSLHRKGRNRPAFGVSLLAALPICLLAMGFLFIALRGDS